MNSIKIFMNLLESKKANAAWGEMTSIVKESHQYFQNIPASERGLILNVLFNEKTGILTFINQAIEEPYINNHLEGTIIQMFHLLVFIMNEFSDVYSPHIKVTQDVCTLTLTIKASFSLKSAAAKAFIVLLQTFASHGLDFNDTIINWVKKFKFYNLSERRLLLEVITVISKYFPQTPAFARYAKTIRLQIMADIAQTCDGTKAMSITGMVKCIEAMNNILYNFPPANEDIGKTSGPEKLYEKIKNLCTSEVSASNKQIMSALVNLLCEHLSLFGDYVYEDYEFWHKKLKYLKQLYGDSAIKALRMYYKTMGRVIEKRDSENDKEIFLNLRNAFEESLSDPRLSSIDLRLAVYGFSQIIEACRNYHADAGVEEIFSLIAHRTIPRYAREDDETIHFDEIADYQEALSRIIRYMRNVTIDQIHALTTLCSLLIKRFPELSPADQRYATSSLNRTLVNVRYTKEILYQEFMSHIVYDGIVWSCSHMLLIDADLKRDVDNLSKRPITYKDYVPLWKGLLNPANYASTDENSESRAAALQRVVDETITTCIILMNTLNINVKSKENNVFSDVKVSQTVENESDFRIFLNLVDLYVEILENIENFLWTNTLEKFLYEIIKNSYKNPLISGFYKLANVVLTSSGSFDFSDIHNLSGETFNLVIRYLWNTLDSVAQYPQELQISCLNLILNVPERFVKGIVERAAPAFKIAFTIGLTNYEVATSALNALERWTKCLGSDCPKDFIRKIVPCLEKYLQSEESSIELMQDIEETKRRIIKKATLLNDEFSVEGFQKRILLFFGSLDSDIMLEFIHKRSLKTGATWSKKDLLKYSVPFPDINLEINLDAMLPRIIELSLTSGDRKTRVIANEVLHTLVAFMLGKQNNDNNRFASLYEILCPALIRLGCDSDSVIMQIFNPLMMQITHWLSSRIMLDSLPTIHLVDSLFEGLSDETNSSLRDASGIYLAEFVHWSIKQSSDRNLVHHPTNINLIVQRIINFALDPSANKRVAAAIAFNHLYKILRENEEIVKRYWFEILHAFVKSLEGCNDSRIRDALRHVERVLVERKHIFNEIYPQRIQPPGFSGVRTEDAAKWLLEQCGSQDRNCRRKCIQLFSTISTTVNGGTSAKGMISGYLKLEGLEGLNRIVLRDLDEKFQMISVESSEIFLKTLDLYVWLLREKLIDHETLLSDLNPCKNVVFDAVGNFVSITLTDSENFEENQPSIRPQERVKLKTLKCEILITLFDFVPLLLEIKAIKQEFVPDYVFNEKLFELVSRCLLEPQKIGFDSSNLQLTEELPLKLEKFFNCALQNLPEPLTNSMKNVFAKDIQRFSRELFQFDKIKSNEVSINEQSIKGLILLHKCHLLKLCADCSEITENAGTKITQIFEALSTEELGRQNVCFEPTPEVKIYFQRLIELLLLEYDTETMKIVTQLLINKDKLFRSDFTSAMAHGEYFLSVFKDAIIRGCLKDIEKTLNLLEISILENPDAILRITEAFVLYLQRHKSEFSTILDKSADLVMKKFNVFERAVVNLEHRKNVFLNIYAVVVRLKRSPFVLDKNDEIYRWLLTQLIDSNKFKYKIRLLRDFLVCLTNESSEENHNLTLILHNLKNERTITCPDNVGENKIPSPETVDCFQTLLKLLLITKSSIVFDGIVNFAQGAGKLLCADTVNDYLKLYFSCIAASNALKSLEIVYKRFINSNETDDRFDVLSYFLLPSFAHCSPQIMETFFERNIKDIHTIIMQKPTEILADRQQLFVSKIGCYNLVEIMFANLSKDKIDSNDSLITINSKNEDNPEEKLSKRIFRSTLPIRQLKAREGDNLELFRRMQCAAYNCCIAIVSMAKDERFYVAVFGENRDKHQLIWENIVDVNRQYELRQTSKEYPKERKKLINIRKSDKETKNHDNYSYIKSYDLATSTLSDNISAYDLNAVYLLPRFVSSEKNETMSLTLEIDDLNDHECMAPVCGLLIHMLNNEISRPTTGNVTDTLPKWMSQFRNSMMSEHANVRLFMLKIVLNTQVVFKPYADFFLEPIINTIYLALKNGPLNYIITDALVMLVDWHEISIPKRENGKKLARSMFSVLVEKATAAPTKYIVKYNMEIIEMIVGAWHDCLQVPEGLKDRMNAMDRLAIRVLLIFLTNKMAGLLIDRQDVWEYLEKCVNDWTIEEETVLQSFQAVGLMLRYSDENVEFKKKIVDISRSVFRKMQLQNAGRLVKCVHALCKACPILTEEFFQFISSNQQKVDPSRMVKCLEIFSLMIPRLSPENIIKELNYMQFNGFLANKILACEKICLEIVQQLVEILEPIYLLPIVRLVSDYADHQVLEYREICYDTSIKLYKKYSDCESADIEIIEIMDISKRILLSGLMDPTEKIQKLATDFWADATKIRSKCSERLLDILDIYTPGVEKNFLQIMTHMLLQLSKKSASFDDKIFTEPLHNCNYVNHDISVSWKTRNFESRIPLFAPSIIANQWNQRLTQYSYVMGSSSYGQQTQNDFMLRATNEPQFEATFLGEPSHPTSMTEEGIFAVPKVPEITKNKVSRRFLDKWSERNSIRQKDEAAKKFSAEEYRREYQARQRSSVKLYRKYRIGDFPDIEISHSTLLNPMQELAKKDSTICKNLIVCLIRSLIVRIASTNEFYCRDLSDRLVSILNKRQRNGGVTVSAIFEILFNIRELEFPWKVVTECAKNDGLFAQGALLAERSLMLSRNEISEPPAKRFRVENPVENENIERWIELAELYDSMNEIDVVLSIFRGEIFSNELQIASAARAAADWENAEISYRNAFENETNSQMKNHCLQGMFECMSRLSKWKKLENEINSKVEPNLESLLDVDDSCNDPWIAPWIFRTQSYRVLNNSITNDFSIALQSYLQNPNKCQRLKELFGEEIAVILIKDNPEISRDFLNGSTDEIRKEWIRLSPLAVPLRSAAIVKLQGIHDIDCYLKTIESPDIIESSKALLKFWQNRGPSISDDLLSWDKNLSYRSHFTSCLIDKLGNTESQEGIEIIRKFRLVRVEKMLKLIDCALNQRNSVVAKKYLRDIEEDVEIIQDQELIDDYALNAIRWKYLSAETLNDPSKSLKYYVNAWTTAQKILHSKDLSYSSQIGVRKIVSKMSTKFVDLAKNRKEFYDNLISQTTIIQDIFTERIDFDDDTDSLKYYSFSNLKKCCDIPSENGECYLALAKYCYERIAENSDLDAEISREFVRSTLKAMRFGSEEATHYFPCLLREKLLDDEETRKIFLDESCKVETWRFIIWQMQLLSHIGTKIGDLVLPILKEIIKMYPNALVYSLRLTLDTNPHLRDDPSIRSLTDLLKDNSEFNKFLEAIEYVVQPELYLQYQLKQLTKNLSQGKATVVENLMKKVYPANFATGSCAVQGDIYKIIAPYKKEIEEIIEMPIEDVQKRVYEIDNRLRQSLEKREDKLQLKDYSPWLHEFVGREIEVPGQYTGEKKPMPQYHAKIVKIEYAVKVMKSKTRPIRITMVASNAKNYRFLVKFGDDLRLDQRVEQVFHVMNKTLKADVACAQRRLFVDTYQVFPLSGSLGFLQWIDGTMTLNDYVNFSLDDNKKKQHPLVFAEYKEWMQKAAPGQGLTEQYKKALLKYSSADVVAKMTDFRHRIGSDLLRSTFVLLSPSMESFMSLRQNFTTSYATLCIAQWILGIGDRNLGNTLISIESGRSLGIDFESAFGGAVDQSIPELMPFRLTAQITGLLEPFNENDLMRATMIHVLRALRNGKGPLLACLNVVAHEQLNWESHINKLSQEAQSEAVDIKWLPSRKVEIVSKKLNGEKPSTITAIQLMERHSNKDYFYRYCDVVNGTDSNNKSKRSFLKEKDLSPEEQVQCLIEQATDLNVLGRTFVGWTPWI